MVQYRYFVHYSIDLDLIYNNKFLKKLSETEYRELLHLTIEKLTEIEETDWTDDNLQAKLNEFLVATGKKPAEYFSLIRIAVSFAPFSPALHQTLRVLGKNRTLARLNRVHTAISHD